jgi:hypothetical protein
VGFLLTWTDHHLALWNDQGQVQGRVLFSKQITAVAAADDGSVFAVGDEQGEVRLLAPDLSVRWSSRLPGAVTALALQTNGEFLAAADACGGLTGFDPSGRILLTVPCARPIVHLLLPPGSPLLLAAADFGLVGALDLRRRVWAWRDVPVLHIGSITATCAADLVVLACFTHGLQAYDRGGRQRTVPWHLSARSALLAVDGRHLLRVGIDRTLTVHDRHGAVCLAQRQTPPIVAAAFSLLGDRIWSARIDGTIRADELTSAHS